MTPKPISRRTISLPEATWRLVDVFRFGRHIRRESDAIRMLIEAGYAALDGKQTADSAAGEQTTKKAAPELPRKRPK